MRLKVLVMAATKTHKLDAKREPGRWRAGEIVSVSETDEVAGPDGSPAFYRVYISDWAGTLDEAREKLTQDHRTNEVDATLRQPIARRKLVLSVDNLSRGLRARIKRNRFIEITTAQFMAALMARKANVRDQFEAAVI